MYYYSQEGPENHIYLNKFPIRMGRPGILLLTFVLQLSAALQAFAQSPASNSPVLHYTLRIDSSDLSGYTVSIRVYPAPHRFRLAMATHHEYDDRFWKNIRSFQVDAPASYIREDSAVWVITTPGDEAQVTYRIQLPPSAPLHFSHRPFLSRNGGLVGDLHSFMYLVEDPHALCRLTLQLPTGWQAATGLDPMSATAPQLLDAPILVGRLYRWDFTVDGIPHEVAWLSGTDTTYFDTVALVANIQKIVRTTAAIFGSFPYRHYSFLLEDNSAGALEHGNSVTIGVPANILASGGSGIYEEIAHEFFHTWNLMHIRPSGYTELNYGPQQQSPGLWFSEGVTMMYADLICRRTGLPVDDSTRIAHLSSLITRYYRDTGNMVLSPSSVSLASNLQPGPLGDYAASTHLQGELLGSCLDMLIKDITDGLHSFDDVMREAYRRFGDKQPFRDSDIEAAVTTVCGCSAAQSFFQNYLYKGKPIDFAPWIKLLGLRLRHDQLPATDPQGRFLPDTRVYSWTLRDDTSVRIGITNPNSCWALAGLHTGDIIAAINSRPIHTRQDFQADLGTLNIGDTVIVNVKKGAATTPHTLYISGYTMPVIHLTKNPAATAKQQRLLRQWLDSK
jgi:predicted metalloprotease with PDZ domain